MTDLAIARHPHPTNYERMRLEHQHRYSSVAGLPQVWAIAAEHFGNIIALDAPHATPPVAMTYHQLWAHIQHFAIGLQSLGVMPETHVALFSENNPRWLIADQGTMTVGAVDVVRSSQADRDELLYILNHSDATTLIVENQTTLDKLQDKLTDLPIHLVILLSDEDSHPQPGQARDLKIVNFNQVMAQGGDHPLQPVERAPDALATLLYTSGTTGKPKGVQLAHRNLLHQVNTLGSIVQIDPGDRILAILPTWHIYERTVEYFALSQGCTLIYTDLRHFKQDLKDRHPQYFVSVPRLLEAIQEGIQKQIQRQPAPRKRLAQGVMHLSRHYVEARRTAQGLSVVHPHPSPLEKAQAIAQTAALAPVHALGERLVYSSIREGLGGQLKQIINGGSKLRLDLETLFEMIGVEIIVGYGLTETSPVITARRPWHNLRGSVGQPIMETAIRIVDPETRDTLPQEQAGSVLVCGPQIMAGYYKNPDATAKAIDAEGWFDTEDRGWLTDQNDLILTGRIKDTIVLSNGENVDPQPIEDACSRSPYIEQIVVVGDDERSLGALIVPHIDALKEWAAEHSVDLQWLESPPEGEVILSPNQPVVDRIRQELNREVKHRPGYSPNDRIGPFRLLATPFSVENNMMTQTLKIKRHVVIDRYRDVISQMFA